MSRTKSLLRHLLCRNIDNKGNNFHGFIPVTGNAVAVPAVVAMADPALEPYVSGATTQVAAAVVVTAIIAPLMTSYWAKKYGCPKMPLKTE